MKNLLQTISYFGKQEKVTGKDRIHLIENNELVKTDLETAEVLNNFFFEYSTES